MTAQLSLRTAAVITAFSTFLSIAPATVGDAIGQTADEARCRATIAKETARYVKTVFKLVTKCHKLRSKGALSLATDCNDPGQADSKGKLGSAHAKARAKIVSRCTSGAVLARYGRCPSPAADTDDLGATTGIDSFDELADCLVGLADGMIAQAGRRVIGKPAGSIGTGLAKCQKELGKGLAKLIATIAKERARCQSGRDKNQLGLDYGCVGADPSQKIAKAKTKLDRGVDKRCAVDDDPGLSLKQEIDSLDSCGDTLAQLKECAGDAVGMRLGSGVIAMAYELPSTCSAGQVTRLLRSGGGEQFTDTFLSTGWTGTSHLVDVLDRAGETVNLLSCDADCGACQMSLALEKGEPNALCRCALNPTQSCDTFNGLDLDDCGLLDTCNCFFGAPLPLSSGGVPVCVLNRHTSDIQETLIDVGTGQQQGTVVNSALVHLGENTQLEPCPTCQNDPIPKDGIRGGTCTRGLRIGQACDIGAIHPDFGPTSHDCPPNSVTNVSGSGLFLRLPYKSVSSSIPYTLPCDQPPGALCPCLTCSGDTLVGCSSDDQCASVGAGTCSVSGGAGARPNACGDGVCTDGFCLAGPTENFCDAIVRQNGRGFLQCNTDVDCAALNAGSCTIEQTRPCHDNPLTIEGEATVFQGDLSALFCIPPTNSAAVNNSAGLPGAGASTLATDFTVKCASDPSVVWEPPGGTNCP